jgi:hypothetical protein
VRAIAPLVALCLLAGGCGGCGKKKEEAPIGAPPPRGAASSDELSTGIGQARGLDESMAPTSTKWRRVFPIDDKKIVITGEVGTETIALISDDGGKTWHTLRNEREAWANWSVALDGSIATAIGARAGASSVTGGTLEATQLLFASFDTPSLTPPTPLFPALKGPAKGLLESPSAIPALLGPGAAALVGEEAPRKQGIFYGGKPGSEASPPLKLPTTEKFVPVPFGRAPSLLSAKGRVLQVRPFPAPGKPLDPPQKVANVTATPTIVAELSAAPACEAGAWSFARVKQPPNKLQILGASPTKTVTFALPEGSSPTGRVGCGGGRVVVEAGTAKEPSLVTCDLAGKCVKPQNAPFRPWAEQHQDEVTPIGVEQGVLAVMTSKAGQKWGLYLAQSGEGVVWERPRIIGEGSGDRGRLELGALVSLGKRALILLSADVTGTTSRRWFVMVSDDGGANWAPP